MFCPKCGTQLSDDSVACNKCGTRFQRRSYLKLSVIMLSVLVVLAVAGYFANRQMKLSALNSKLEEAVGKDAGYIETIIKVEAEASSMSYQEFFELCEKSIEGRTNLLVELRGLYPEIQSDLKHKLIDFLNAENELVRQKSHFYRKQLSFSTAFDSYNEHLSDYPTSSYGWEYWIRRSTNLKSEIVKAASEMTESANGFISTYKSLVAQETGVKKEMEAAGLRFTGFFEKYQESNIKFAEDAKTLAEGIKL